MTSSAASSVAQRSDPVARRRTFAIISHPDAGKTTLTEKLLLFGGAIQLAGEVRAKANRRQTRSDWMGIEKERGISVVTSVMTFEYGDCVYNLLDTPGHEDFSEDTYRTLTAVDSAIMVLDAARGIEARTRKLFEVCRLRDIPIVTFINKLDRETRDPFELLDEIEKTLALDVAPITWPLGQGRGFVGTYDLEKKAGAPARPRHRRRAGGRGRTIAYIEGLMKAPDFARDGGADRAGDRRPEEVRSQSVSGGAPDAGVLRLGAAQFRHPRSHRRAGRVRAGAAGAGGGLAQGRRARDQDDRVRIQDPGEHGQEPPRPHRLHAHLLGQARRAA